MVNKLLIITEKFCDANPASGPTNSEIQLVGAIESTGLVREIKHFYYEVLAQKMGIEKMSELLLEDCAVFKPDLILYSAMGGLLGYQLNPTDAVLFEIRQRGIPIYTCLWDTEGREWETWERWLPPVDGVLIIDTIVREQYYKRDPRIIQAYSAIDPRYFFNQGLERDIDVCFVGRIDTQRRQFINLLEANGIKVVAVGGQRANRLSWEEYANFINRSKIALSFTIVDIMSRTIDGQLIPRRTSQLKGRVFETLSCGTMLMEDDGYQTKELFEPGTDYVMFHNESDLLYKIHYYLAHDEERQSIAQSGYEKVTGIYNARNMWSYIFEKIGFQLPREVIEDNSFLMHKKLINSLIIKHEAIMEGL